MINWRPQPDFPLGHVKLLRQVRSETTLGDEFEVCNQLT